MEIRELIKHHMERQVTRNHIVNLLMLFKNGLIGTAGNTMTEFCVQQAVHRVIDEDLENASKSADPPNWCVCPELVSFGVVLNDFSGWTSEQTRAKGLQKFAIAELGSAELDWHEFCRNLEKKLHEINPEFPDELHLVFEQRHLEEWMKHPMVNMDRNDRLTLFANTAAKVLEEMGTEGSQFLHLVDEPDPWKKRELAHRLGDKAYAAQMCSFGRCTPVTKAKHH
jgi:hypothetical protein